MAYLETVGTGVRVSVADHKVEALLASGSYVAPEAEKPKPARRTKSDNE